MSPEINFDGKAIVITGSGRGIGAACARAVSALGARVIINDVDEAVAAEVADEIARVGGTAIAHACDISDFMQAGALIERCILEYGQIDGLVNNAGILRYARIDEITPLQVQSTFAVNVAGTVYCAHHAAKHMMSQRCGAIVNVTSGAQMGMEANAIYGASKGAVASLTYTWAMELAPFDIRVNAISPMATSRMWTAESEYRQALGQPAMPLRQGPAPEANAPVVSFLLSDRARGVTGQILRINGGQLSLMGHPVVGLPVIEREGWSATEIADAFDRDLRLRQCPLGVAMATIQYAGA